jgi:hypothetical protein
MLARIMWEVATYDPPYRPFVPRCGEFDYSEYNIDTLHDLARYSDEGIARYRAEQNALGNGMAAPPLQLEMMGNAARNEIRRRDLIFYGQPAVTAPVLPAVHWSPMMIYR